MILKGRLEYLLMNIYPSLYMEYVVLDKGVTVLYIRLRKALYGLMHSALLFYTKLATDPKKWFHHKSIWPVHGKQTGQQVNDDSGVTCWWPKSVTQGLILINKVISLLVNNIKEKNQGTQKKYPWLHRDVVRSFRTRGGESINDKISPKYHIWFPIRVERNVFHYSSGTTLPNKREIRSRF